LLCSHRPSLSLAASSSSFLVHLKAFYWLAWPVITTWTFANHCITAPIWIVELIACSGALFGWIPCTCPSHCLHFLPAFLWFQHHQPLLLWLTTFAFTSRCLWNQSHQLCGGHNSTMILMYLSGGFGQALPCDRSRSVGLPQLLALRLCYRLRLIAGMFLSLSHLVRQTQCSCVEEVRKGMLDFVFLGSSFQWNTTRQREVGGKHKFEAYPKVPYTCLIFESLQWRTY